MEKTLTDLAQDGRDFIFGKLGLTHADFEFLGRIKRLGKDERVKEVAFGSIDWLGSYEFNIDSVKPLSENERKELLAQNGFPNPNNVIVASDFCVEYRYDVKGSENNYELKFRNNVRDKKLLERRQPLMVPFNKA